MPISKKFLSAKIKNLRKLNDFTQEQLAESVDITPRQLVRLESGKNYPSIETLWKMSRVFNISVSSLLNEAEIEDEHNNEDDILKSDINDLLSLAKNEQLKLIKKLILAVL